MSLGTNLKRLSTWPVMVAAFWSLEMPVSVLGLDETTPGTAADKSRYNLFNPTPTNLLRELETDRPDETESPSTVDAGHFQLEMDFATYTFDRSDGIDAHAWNVAPFNLRIGLLNNVELSLIFDNYVHVNLENDRAHASHDLDGVGDFTTRLKINLWGNDGGQTAFALFPFIKFPTNTGGIGNDSVEGGAIFPLSIKLPYKIDMGLETGVGGFRNETGYGHHAEFINTVTVSREIIGKLGAYLEFATTLSTERNSEWLGIFDVGFTYSVSKNVQLDCGCNIGVTETAEDVHAFSGISVRF